MTVLIDANVIFDVALNQPGGEVSRRVLDTCCEEGNEGVIAWHTLSIIAYILENRGGRSAEETREALRDLLREFRVAPASNQIAEDALNYQLRDTEDALQIAAGMAAGCSVLVTRNVGDFDPELLPVQTPEEFTRLSNSEN